MNRSKQKGTKGETEVVRYLKANGLEAQRRALSGSLDVGDIEVWQSESPGIHFIVEVKTGKQTIEPPRSLMAEWIEETKRESANAKLPAVLIINRFNRPLRDSYVYFAWHGLLCQMYLDQFVKFIDEHGSDFYYESSRTLRDIPSL